jgi:rfaE bifunctional protein nucleotidyltransferase chain/domain
MNLRPPCIVPLEQAAGVRQGWGREFPRIVATNGCFDLLHIGHLRYLQAARALGDFLWVGINDDASVRQLKGPSRPINSAADRAELLLGLRAVDAVTIFPEARATRFLEAVAPDLYAKGGDYTLESLNAEERVALESAGAEIHLLQLVPGRSTTSVLAKVQGGEA